MLQIIISQQCNTMWTTWNCNTFTSTTICKNITL